MTKRAELMLAWAVGALSVGAMWLYFSDRGLTLKTRPVSHAFGATITVEAPGMKEKAVYFEWCSEGYFFAANGFDVNSPIAMVRDSRCD